MALFTDVVEPDSKPRTLLSLKIAAGLTLFAGILAGVEAMQQLSSGKVPLNPTLLALPAFFGLLHLRDGWRRVVLAINWMGVLLSSVAVLAGLGVMSASYVKIFGTPANQLPVFLTLATGLATASICAWQIHVLGRSDIRELFARQRPSQTTSEGSEKVTDAK